MIIMEVKYHNVDKTYYAQFDPETLKCSQEKYPNDIVREVTRKKIMIV